MTELAGHLQALGLHREPLRSAAWGPMPGRPPSSASETDQAIDDAGVILDLIRGGPSREVYHWLGRLVRVRVDREGLASLAAWVEAQMVHTHPSSQDLDEVKSRLRTLQRDLQRASPEHRASIELQIERLMIKQRSLSAALQHAESLVRLRLDPIDRGLELASASGRHYRLTDRIDSGRFADVWLAERVDTWSDDGSAARYAVKILHPAHRQNEESRGLFRRGAQEMALLGSEVVGVCPCVDHCRFDDSVGEHWFYVMPFYRRGSLAHAIDAEFGALRAPNSASKLIEPRPLEWQEKLAIICRIGETLHAMHRRGRKHRDIKPDNILLAEDPDGTLRPVLSDFEFVQLRGQPSVVLGAVGTPLFAAPEAMEGHHAVPSEVFSLAATLLFALTGRRPSARADLSRVRELGDHVPPSLQDPLRRALARNPGERFQSMTEFVEALAEAGTETRILRLLDEMGRVQGTIADQGTVARLRAHQAAVCSGAFAHAVRLRDRWDAPLDPPRAAPAEAGDPLDAVVDAFLAIIGRYRATRHAGRLEAAAQCLDALHDLARAYVDDARLTFDAHLFADFLVGLGCCEVFIHIGASFGQWLEARRLASAVAPEAGGHRPLISDGSSSGQASYVEGLRKAFALHEEVLGYLRIWFRARNRRAVWGNMVDCWEDHLPDALRAAILRTVSLRNVPGDGPRSRSSAQGVLTHRPVQLATLSQVMHWEGWGGVGAFFDAADSYGENALTRFLRAHKKHTFDWHQTAQLESGANFSHRKDFFAPPATKLADYAAGVAAALLVEPRLDRRSDRTLVRLWGDSVGPKRVAEGRIIENVTLMHLQRGWRPPSFESTLTEISAASLHRLLRYNKTEGESRRLMWRDLNIPFDGEPGTAGAHGAYTWPADPSEADLSGTFDCYSCSISLHQIADRRQRHDRIRRIVAFATRLVRPGGVISLPDVGGGVALQVFILPTNIVDREGGWTGSLFSLTGPDGQRSCRFVDVASLVDDAGRWLGYASEAAAPPPDEQRVRFPVPLLPLHRGSPAPRAPMGLIPHREREHVPFVYESIPYLVIEARLGHVRALDAGWAEWPASVRWRHVEDAIAGWHPPALDAISEVPASLDRLGYELGAQRADLDRICELVPEGLRDG